jgi:hypothetical protein
MTTGIAGQAVINQIADTGETVNENPRWSSR